MNAGLLRALRETHTSQDTEELLHLWVENDRGTYSDEMFEATRSILQQRGVALPAQNDPPPLAERAPKGRAHADEDDLGPWAAWIRPVLWIGVALGVSKLLSWLALCRQYFQLYNESRNYLVGWRVGAAFAEIALSLALPCCLLAGVWAALRRRAAARRVLFAYVAAALGLTALRFFINLYAGYQSSYGMKLEFLLQQAESLLQPNVYPLVLLVLLRRPQVREFFEPAARGFALDLQSPK